MLRAAPPATLPNRAAARIAKPTHSPVRRTLSLDREGWRLLSPAVKDFLLDAGREGHVKLSPPQVANLKFAESGRDAMRNVFVQEYQALCDDVTRLNAYRARSQRVLRHRTPPQRRPSALRKSKSQALHDIVASEGTTSFAPTERVGSPAMRSLASAIANVGSRSSSPSRTNGSSRD